MRPYAQDYRAGYTKIGESIQMDGAKFEKALDELGFSSEDFCKYIRVSYKTLLRYRREGPPVNIVRIIEALLILNAIGLANRTDNVHITGFSRLEDIKKALNEKRSRNSFGFVIKGET